MSVKIEIFDPALCCPTGVCGPSVDPELTRIARDIATLNKKGIEAVRYNLAQNAEPYVSTEVISELLDDEGSEVLPATLVNGKLMKKESYPTTTELAEWAGISEEDLKATQKAPKIDIEIN
ncbi:arsenite efflux transporter metallochaperone ArsD [Bacillus sp. FJAT-45350]|uniref:arsenite efflux transporter metallochaperone ArsD n=1 Tax=Bacillus sp. FJAT-45350 TaxID=2011014 RepID=UPI000BB790F4|nr:arsenite efflux transporter metallochaperone ArsD [Bacillus sp. FJAT-45350]